MDYINNQTPIEQEQQSHEFSTLQKVEGMCQPSWNMKNLASFCEILSLWNRHCEIVSYKLQVCGLMFWPNPLVCAFWRLQDKIIVKSIIMSVVFHV